MAAVTDHLGFGLTTGTAFEHPFPFARRITTLDHLTGGRLGWNVVTGYLPSAAENTQSHGQLDTFDHDARYDHADEYLEVLYKLWEGSWEDDAVLADPLTGVYTDPTKVHPIDHHGRHYTVPGIHVSEPSPQRTPVIFQAGASDRGSTFAATHAEAVFVAAPTQEKLAEVVRTLTRKLEEAGRSREDVVIYALLTVITDATEEKAQAKLAEYRRYVDPEGALVLMSGWMGVDFAGFDLDDPVAGIESNAIQSAVAAFQRSAGEEGREWTVRELAEFGGIGGTGPVVVGSGESVADQLEDWVAATGVDGFNLAYAVTPGTFRDVIEHVVPVLQARGEYPTSYDDGTLRHRLFGSDRVRPGHPAATHSFTPTGAQS
jgi:FMN-dependent oxidoreductase (nitrilotriacetate monooxygenase family)